ncbi:MAG: zinc ribbon domain-containing protein, partial [Halobacteriaceae archaeon]
MAACVHCGSDIESEADVCPECGTPLLDQTGNEDPNRYRGRLFIERIAERTG